MLVYKVERAFWLDSARYWRDSFMYWTEQPARYRRKGAARAIDMERFARTKMIELRSLRAKGLTV